MIGITERGDAALHHEWKPWVEERKPAILITKAPSILINHIKPTDNIIVYCTITGWGGTYLEPNVKPSKDELTAYHQISDLIGKNRTILRIDPIIPTKIGISQATKIFSSQLGRVRLSFLDLYPRSRAKLSGLANWSGFHAPLQDRLDALKYFPGAEVCGEPNIACTGCISKIDCDIFGIQPTSYRKGQRPSCPCLSLKKELLSNREPCAHNCLYCYWR